VSPITKSGNDELSLPKLELTAAVIAVRLKAFLSGSLELQIDKYYLWSDSTITLNWIMGCGNKIKPYVTTRVKEILKLTNIYEWKYCDGKSNPADFLTRGCTAKNLFNNELWKNGPSWLSAKQIHSASNKSMNDILLTFSDLNENIVNQSESFETINKYSNIKKVLRVTAYIMKFISNMQTQKSHRTVQKTSKINDVKNLSAQEIAEAEKLLVKLEQRRYFPEEASYLKNGKILPTTSKLLCLNPTIDDGVIRLSCRISDKDYDKSLTKPAILPKLSRLSRLLIIEAHTVTLHGGVNVVLAYIRKKYWIIQGRQLIKNILYVRAIHLELVKNLTTNSCIDALRRFIARRGCPETIISGNAKTFKRANKELQKLETLLKSEEFQNNAAHKGFSWKFIPERAAWWGGFWERLVKSVKICLKSAIGKLILTYDELNTLLTEVEYVVNICPLTYITNDEKDLEPLTPAHFLNSCQHSFIIDEFNYDRSEVGDLWQKRRALLLSQFGKSEILFLGYTVSKNGIKPPQDRIEAIVNYKQPDTVSDLGRFLGVLNYYRRCIPHLSQHQAQLSDLVRNIKKNDKRKSLGLPKVSMRSITVNTALRMLH
ncbi:uncharacterized protein LOC119664863, partial [Teleopsis dalmanni]|uniref:uncharacterized protein LOC119664863 n=1 Tax=Teleopsis dalmanni TaxID=139649 RepID=UPI0018CCC461